MPITSSPGISWALAAIRAALPTGKGWFSETALRIGEIGHVAGAMAKVSGRLLEDIRQARSGFYLKEAEGDALRLWAQDLAVEPLPGETDEALRNRLVAEMFRERMTRSGVISLISERTGLQTAVSEPWRQEMAFDGDSDWDGDNAYGDDYYAGGVVQITTWDFSPKTRPASLETLALGVKPHYTNMLGSLEGTTPPNRTNEGSFTHNIRGEILIGVDLPDWDEDVPLDGITHVDATFSNLVRNDAVYGYRFALERPNFWITSFSWNELKQATWEEVGFHNFRTEPESFITQNGVELAPTYDQLHTLTYEQLSNYTYDELKSL